VVFDSYAHLQSRELIPADTFLCGIGVQWKRIEMSACTVPAEDIDRAIAFHGHCCPGLVIGIRAAELALQRLGAPSPTGMDTVTETDMCGVDAIQLLTGCTYGKGNLIHRDLGKMAFSFFDHRSGRGLRIVLKRTSRGRAHEDYVRATDRVADRTATAKDHALITPNRTAEQQRLPALDLDDMFDVIPLDHGIPRPARILKSLVCEVCGESVMESRTRRFGGRPLCIPCFEAVDQKV
jgi:formylmethanofuran dehydrogenase subunit E